MLSRAEALELLRSRVSKRNWLYHMLAVEAVMKGLATHLGEDEEKWGLLGLLHDIDFSQTEATPDRHGLEAEKILEGKVPEDLIRAIKAHNSAYTGVEPTSNMEKALIAADAVSGLIVATALVMPSRKVSEVTIKTLEKKFKQKDFAKGVDRDRISLHEELGIPREKFLEIALNSLRSIADSIGL
ncbi:MAG: HDIG domain-containing protein [Candidatus Bathyarchaeia archaeon]|nr:HDIG domain-containing protein [Candidatus Bathyarchaeota archaeon]